MAAAKSKRVVRTPDAVLIYPPIGKLVAISLLFLPLGAMLYFSQGRLALALATAGWLALLGVFLKIMVFDCLRAIVRPRPTLILDRNGISYVDAWGVHTTALWDEVHWVGWSKVGFGFLVVAVDVPAWLSTRGRWDRFKGRVIMWISRSYFGVPSPLYVHGYRIGVGPAELFDLVREVGPPQLNVRMLANPVPFKRG